MCESKFVRFYENFFTKDGVCLTNTPSYIYYTCVYVCKRGILNSSSVLVNGAAAEVVLVLTSDCFKLFCTRSLQESNASLCGCCT